MEAPSTLNAGTCTGTESLVRNGLATLLLFIAGSCAKPAKPPTTVAQDTTVQGRGTTQISVTRAPDAETNPICTGYCRQIRACWLNLPNTDPMVAPDDAERRCLLEQSNCERPTADLHCCSKLADCREFSDCIAISRNVLSACDEPLPGSNADQR
jgi:hypothetical protein